MATVRNIVPYTWLKLWRAVLQFEDDEENLVPYTQSANDCFISAQTVVHVCVHTRTKKMHAVRAEGVLYLLKIKPRNSGREITTMPR